MGNNVLELKTSSELLSAIKRAAQIKQTPKQMLEQRVSYVVSVISSKSNATREHIKQVIAEQEGIDIK